MIRYYMHMAWLYESNLVCALSMHYSAINSVMCAAKTLDNKYQLC